MAQSEGDAEYCLLIYPVGGHTYGQLINYYVEGPEVGLYRLRTEQRDDAYTIEMIN